MSTALPKRREDETRLSASHLTKTSDEDWGDVPAPPNPSKPSTVLSKKDLTDDEVEQELENNPVTVATEPVTTPPVTDDATQSALRQLESLQKNLPDLTQALETSLKLIANKRAALDNEEAEIKKRINLVRVLNGQKPLAEEEEEDEAPRNPRRGGRRKKGLGGLANTSTAPAATEGATESAHTGKRPHNDFTLKQAICKALYTMPNYTGDVKSIAAKVLADGYQSTSKMPTNTVRIQIYRLHAEKDVRKNDDGTYTLTKAALDTMRS